MSSSGMPHSDRTILRFTVGLSTAFIGAAFCLSYATSTPRGLPLGSDSSAYAGQAQLVASSGPLALFAVQGPYNFLYQFIAGLIVWIGVPAIDVEIVVPVILAASLPYLLSRLALIYLSTRAATLVALATPGWYAVYRIAADLDANLLGVVFCLGSIILLSKASSIRQQRCLAGLALLCLASISHIESTVLFASIFVIASFSSLRLYPIRVAYATLSTIVPATVLYVIDFQQILGITGGTYDFSTAPMGLTSWITYLGPVFPLAALGVPLLLTRRGSWLEFFVMVWCALSLFIGLSQYGSPQLTAFAKRAAILTPIPLLVPFGMGSLVYAAGKLRAAPIRVLQFRRTLVVVFVVLIVSSWPFVYETAASQNLVVFITTPQYQQLVWVKSNIASTPTPIFMFNDYDQYAGGLARQYDNWVSAIIGTHLSYLGLTDYLVRFQETPFLDHSARVTSAFFMQQIRDEGIVNRTSLLQHQIVLMGDFYQPFPLPSYTSGLFSQVAPGIYVDNPVRMQTLSNFTLPLYTSFIAHSGSWGAVNASWTMSGEAYEVYANWPEPMGVEASFFLGVPESGLYSIGLRYWDQTGNNLTISLDSRLIGVISYDNNKTAVLRVFSNLELAGGTHMFTISIGQVPYPLKWASLDYVYFSKT